LWEQEANKSNSDPIRIYGSEEYLLLLAEKGRENAVFIEYPFVEYGLLCNNLHQVASALDFALSYRAKSQNKTLSLVVAFDHEMGNMLKEGLDIQYLVHIARILSSFRTEQLGLTNATALYSFDVLFDWHAGHKKNAFQLKHSVITMFPMKLMQKRGDQFSFALTLLLRPNAAIRAKVDEYFSKTFAEHQDTSLVSVHRRIFPWCTATYKRYGQFCKDGAESGWERKTYYPDDCNITYNDDLMKSLREKWKGIAELEDAVPSMSDAKDKKRFAFFMASDLHDLYGDRTFGNAGAHVFSIPHPENQEHYYQAKILEYRKSGIFRNLKRMVLRETGLDMNWDFSMMVDMEAEMRSAFSLGSPWSSCDRILAMWKSVFAKAAYEAFDTYGSNMNTEHFRLSMNRVMERDGTQYRMYPPTCYDEFEKPGPAMLVSSMKAYRKWWDNYGLPTLFSPNPKRIKFTDRQIIDYGIERIETV